MLDKTFCASPWFHMRIDPQGNFMACRWQKDRDNDTGNIADTSITEFFQKRMAPLRQALLQGHQPDRCSECYHMESHHKVSGRQRQLLKVGVDTKNFVKTTKSSAFLPSFCHTSNHQGNTDLMPQDWQIDLGNYCNSACIFCKPTYSSRLANDYLQLGLIDALPGPNWADNPGLVDKFCGMLENSGNLVYLHFLGGETLIIPAFQRILQRLIDLETTEVHIGFTTNLTVWPDSVIALLQKFSNVHVGLSIECLHDLNDYLRWPSRIDQVRTVLYRWIAMSHQNNWMVQLRPTPNCFTVLHITQLYQFAVDNAIGVETCNFIQRPKAMKINALCPELIQQARDNLNAFVDSHAHDCVDDLVINTRSKTTIRQQVLQDAQSYLNYLEQETHDPTLPESLVQWLHMWESRRQNCILDYAPEYENFLRNSGY